LTSPDLVMCCDLAWSYFFVMHSYVAAVMKHGIRVGIGIRDSDLRFGLKVWFGGPARGSARGWAEMGLGRNWELGRPAPTRTRRSGIVRDAPEPRARAEHIDIHIHSSTILRYLPTTDCNSDSILET
jgi:hypothetical protein